MALQISHYDGSLKTPARPLSALVEEVLRSVEGVAVQRAELAKLELVEGARRGAFQLALLLGGSVCLGIVAAVLWGVLLAGLVWLAADALGVPQAVFVLWAIHAVAAVAAGQTIRARLARTEEESER